MHDIAIVWDLNGVLFKKYIPDLNTFRIVKRLNTLGYEQYVCTNTISWRLGQYRFKYGLGKGFKKVYSTQAMGLIKTDPRVFSILKRDIQKELILIDDKKKNIDVALSLGLKTILYRGDSGLISDLNLLGILNDTKRESVRVN